MNVFYRQTHAHILPLSFDIRRYFMYSSATVVVDPILYDVSYSNYHKKVTSAIIINLLIRLQVYSYQKVLKLNIDYLKHAIAGT